MTKEIKIDIPKGYEIDKENSTFECIKFKLIVRKFNYIDLGLPSGTLWADRNVGAEYPADYGYYLTFDETCNFKLPKDWQFRELMQECKWEWRKDAKGYLVTGPNDNSIFFPATGPETGQKCNGSYWSHTFRADNSDYVYSLYFDCYGVICDLNERRISRNVRTILNKQ